MPLPRTRSCGPRGASEGAPSLTAFVDANVLIPPAGDPPSRSRRATAVLASLDLLLLADVVLAKCVFVLASFCGLSERGSRR